MKKIDLKEIEKRLDRIILKVKEMDDSYAILNEIRRLLHTVVPNTEKCRVAWAAKHKDPVYTKASAAYALVDKFLTIKERKDEKKQK
jgi:NADH:ubiquinone oxidoreductase subunit D